MNNHFHVVIETPDANLVEGMRWLLSAYTIRLNHRHKLVGHGFSGRDIVLLLGGLFLIAKSTSEIHGKIAGEEQAVAGTSKKLSMKSAIFQILLLDVVFSFDSILTAIGLVNEIVIMVAAVIISMIVMLAAASTVSDFINRHPTIKMLALSFLLMIGFMLVVEAFDIHVPKGYVYFAMAFAVLVEVLNMRLRKKKKSK